MIGDKLEARAWTSTIPHTPSRILAKHRWIPYKGNATGFVLDEKLRFKYRVTSSPSPSYIPTGACCPHKVLEIRVDCAKVMVRYENSSNTVKTPGIRNRRAQALLIGPAD